jgi:beta-lactamase regulating signal transducer with metallopeptidase domain
MAWLISIAISNAIVASLLGVIAYVICRNTKSKALAHGVWVLVLIKLVTPPLIDLPLPIMPEWAANSSSLAAHASIENEVPQAQPKDGINKNQLSGNAVAGVTASESAASGHLFSSAENATFWQTAGSWLLWVWLIGAVLFALYQIYVTTMMVRLMKLAVPDPRIDRSINRIAKAANINNYPTARVVPWVTSPMLWGLRGTSVIVLPSGLLESIDDDAADTLLRHELAHFQRGDQWVRILEIFVSTIFWWHPVVWIALNQIEIYEEQCCDAWVVAQDPENRRRYAEALLDTVDYLSDAQGISMPVVASGLGRVRLLKKRVKAILAGEKPVGLKMTGWIVLGSVLVLLPLQPILLQASNSKTDIAKSDSKDSDAKLAKRLRSSEEESSEEFVAHIPGPEYAKALSPYGTYELTVSRGYEVKLKQVVRGNTKDLSNRQISCAAFAPPNDGAPKFVAGSRDGSVWMYDCESGSAVESIGEFGSEVHSVSFSRDGSLLAVGTASGLVLIVATADPRNVRRIENDAPVRCVRFSSDGKQLVVTTDTTWQRPAFGKVDVWTTDNLTRTQTIACPSAVGAATIDSDGNVLTVEWNGMLRTWSPSGVLVNTVQESKDAVSAAAFSVNAVNLETLGINENSTQ